MNDREQMLRTAADSLRNIISVRDFMVAIQVGAEVAISMLISFAPIFLRLPLWHSAFARIGPRLPTLVAFAATPRDDVGQIIAAVIVGNLGTCSDVLDGAYDDLVAYPVGLRIGPARMICIASEVLSARSVDRPTAVDLVKIAVASGLKFIGLLAR
jgi:hypothetical protein